MKSPNDDLLFPCQAYLRSHLSANRWASVGNSVMRKILILLLLIPMISLAAPPYDITVTFTAPTTGGAPDGYRLYVGDCAVTGPVGSAVGSVVLGQVFPALIVADGTYDFCVRPFNVAGEQPDPGQVATAIISDLPLPGPVNNLGIQVTCPASNCVINVTVQ